MESIWKPLFAVMRVPLFGNTVNQPSALKLAGGWLFLALFKGFIGAAAIEPEFAAAVYAWLSTHGGRGIFLIALEAAAAMLTGYLCGLSRGRGRLQDFSFGG